MKIEDLKQPYRRMAEYYRIVERSELTGRIEIYIPDEFPTPDFNNWFWTEIKKGKHPEITEEIKEHFPSDFDFSGEEEIHADEWDTCESKLLHWAKALENKRLSIHELIENARWLINHFTPKMILKENKNNHYTQLAKDGKFDELPATCEFSEPVELEVWDDDGDYLDKIEISGKYKGYYMDSTSTGLYSAYQHAQLPTKKIDFTQFKTGDVVEVVRNDNEHIYGLLWQEDEYDLNLTFSNESDKSKYILKKDIKSITKIK
jgi:hypothetical protein